MKYFLILGAILGTTSAYAEYCDWHSAQDKVAEQVKKEMCKNSVTDTSCDNLKTGAVGVGIAGKVKVLYSYDFHSSLGTSQIAGYRVLESDCSVVDEGAENFLFKKY
jgi:hypothetical protein